MDFNKILSGAKTTIEFGKKHYDKIPNKYKDFIEEESYNLEDRLLSKGNELIKSTNKTEEFRSWLNTPLKWSERDKELLEKSKLISPFMIGIGSVTVADFLYSMSQMNPNIIKALDFSKVSTDIYTFEDIRSFIAVGSTNMNLDDLKNSFGATNKLISEYSGFMNGSQQFDPSVIGDLAQDLQIPETSPLFEQLGVEDVVGVGIPIITMATSSYKAFKKYDSGLMGKGEALKYVALDTIAPAVGSYAGAQLGFAVGSMLAPVTGGISLVIGPILGGIAGFIFGRKVVRSQREEKIIKAYNVFQHSLVELSNRTLFHKNRIRDYLAETTRNQRMTFRKIMVDAVLNDGVRLCTKEPSYNFIVLNEIANRYKEDSQIIWDTRKKLTEKVLIQYKVQLGDQVQEVVPYIFGNRGVIELSEPSMKPYFEESIDKWREFNRIKEAYS